MIAQTVTIPTNRRITLDVPPQVPPGKTIISFTPTAAPLHDCSICAGHIDPDTGNPRYNAETVSAIEEGISISCGEISAKRFDSLAQMLEDLEKDDLDD